MESGVGGARARVAAHVEGSANLSICARSTLVTMSLTSAPMTAPKVTPIVPTAHGADHEPSGSRLTTSPVPTRMPPMNATLPIVRKSRPGVFLSSSL